MPLFRPILLCIALCAGSLSAKAARPEIVEQVRQSTVYIELSSGSSGSGFYLGGYGYILTAAHVVDGLSPTATIRVKPYDITSAKEWLPATVLALDQTRDLAMLKVETKPRFFLTTAEKPPAQLDEVIVCGYPFGKAIDGKDALQFEPSLNLCNISAFRKSDTGGGLLQLDSLLNPGNSGGPVIDSSGNVIGVVSSGIVGRGINFASDLLTIQNFLRAPTSLKLTHSPATEETLEEGLNFQIDTYFIRPIDGQLDISMTLRPNNQDAQTIQLQKIGEGAFSGKALPIHTDRGSELTVSARVFLHTGAIKMVSVKNAKVPDSRLNLSELSNLLFPPGNTAKVVSQTGSILSVDKSRVWNVFRRGISGENDLRDYNEDDVIRIDLLPPLPLLDIELEIEVRLAGQSLAVLKSVVDLSPSSQKSKNSSWVGPQVTPKSQQWLWGPPLRETKITSPAADRGEATTLQSTPTGSSSGAVNVRFPKDNSAEPASRIIRLPGGSTDAPMPFFFGKRLLFHFVATRSYGVFDMTVGDFIAYIHVDADDVFFAPLNDQLYAFINQNQLTRINADSLNVEGTIELLPGFKIESLWGGLGRAKHLVFIGREPDQKHNASIYFYDTSNGKSQKLVAPDDYAPSEGHSFHCMDNNTVLVSQSNLEFHYFDKPGMDFIIASHAWPPRMNPAPLDWSGRYFLDSSGTILDALGKTLNQPESDLDVSTCFQQTAIPFSARTQDQKLQLFDTSEQRITENQTDAVIDNASHREIKGLYKIGRTMFILHGDNQNGNDELQYEVLETRN